MNDVIDDISMRINGFCKQWIRELMIFLNRNLHPVGQGASLILITQESASLFEEYWSIV